MPEYLSPGVYMEEVETGGQPIEGVSTSTAGFVGRTERGPTAPRLVTSWQEYVRWFGGYLDQNTSYLPYAVKGFFDNSGQRLYIARVTAAKAVAASISLPSAGNPDIVAEAIGPGAWGSNMLIRISDPQSQAAKDKSFFRLTLLYYAGGIPTPFLDPTELTNLGDPLFVPPDVTEEYETLSPDRTDANFFVNVVNSRSNLIQFPDDTPAKRPDNLEFPVTASHDYPTADADTNLRVFAQQTGANSNVSVEIVDAGATIKVTGPPEDLKALAPNAAVAAINNDSALVTASWVGPSPPDLPAGLPIAATVIAGHHDFPTAGDPATSLRLTVSATLNAATTVTVAMQAGAQAGTFDITVTPAESFQNLTPANLITSINGTSDLIEVEWSQANPPNPITPALPTPAAAAPLGGGAGQTFDGGFDGTVVEGDYIGDESAPINERTGLAALRSIDDISILSAPDEVRFNTGQLTNKLINQSEQLKDRFAVLNIADRSGLVTNVVKPADTSYGAVYYPFVRIMDPRSRTDILIPPSGHVAGIYARVDVDRGVHKAPANEVVQGILTRDLGPDRKPLEFTLSKAEQDILNPKGVDVIRDFRSQLRDIRVWGARTMSSDSQWKYVNVRRLFIFLEQSIERGTQWVVFEPNDETTWAAVRRSITAFLTSVWHSGALFGAKPEQAFFVKCDATTMTQDDIDNGRLICLIGVAPVKPAEFVIFRISQKTADAAA